MVIVGFCTLAYCLFSEPYPPPYDNVLSLFVSPMEKEKDKENKKDSTKVVDEIHLQSVFFKRIYEIWS